MRWAPRVPEFIWLGAPKFKFLIPFDVCRIYIDVGWHWYQCKSNSMQWFSSRRAEPFFFSVQIQSDKSQAQLLSWFSSWWNVPWRQLIAAVSRCSELFAVAHNSSFVSFDSWDGKICSYPITWKGLQSNFRQQLLTEVFWDVIKVQQATSWDQRRTKRLSWWDKNWFMAFKQSNGGLDEMWKSDDKVFKQHSMHVFYI